MQRIAKRIVYVLMAVSAALMVMVPSKVYVDRFLMEMSYTEWVPYQLLPAMYSTEILITELKTGRQYSKVHHPLRIFFELHDTNYCGDHIITVSYRDVGKSQVFRLCDETLSRVETDPESPVIAPAP